MSAAVAAHESQRRAVVQDPRRETARALLQDRVAQGGQLLDAPLELVVRRGVSRI